MKELLSSQHPPIVRHSAAWVLHAVTVPNSGKKLAVDQDLIPRVIELLKSPVSSLRAAGAGALMTITVDVEGKRAFVAHGGVAPLTAMLDEKDVNMLVHVLQVRYRQGSRQMTILLV